MWVVGVVEASSTDEGEEEVRGSHGIKIKEMRDSRAGGAEVDFL